MRSLKLTQAVSSGLRLLIREADDRERIGPRFPLADCSSPDVNRSVSFPEDLSQLLNRNPYTHRANPPIPPVVPLISKAASSASPSSFLTRDGKITY